MPQVVISVFTWLAEKIGYETVKKTVKISSYLVGWGIFLSAISFILLIISKVNVYINDVFTLTNSLGGSSCIAKNFIAGLNCSGILPAINDMLPIFLSAVGSVFLVHSYKLSLMLRRTIERFINNIFD